MRIDRASRAVRLALLVARAWLLLACVDVLKVAGFARVYSVLRRIRPARRRSWAQASEIVWAVDEACVWYVKRAACLQRSVVVTWLLRRHGIPAETVIGCRPLPFESHAWVEVNGQVVNDRPQYQNAFAVLDRL